MKERKLKLRSERNKALEEIRILKIEHKYLIEKGKVQRVDVLKEFKQCLEHPNLTWEEQNDLYKTLIDYITYSRVGDGTKIEITFK